jgi:hypothetical protein
LVLPLAVADDATFLTVAEALSSGAGNSGIQAGHRMFTLTTIREACASRSNTETLESTVSVKLHAGRWFSLDGFSVIARDTAGKRLPPVPLVIEVDEGARSLLDLKPEMTASDKLFATRKGAFRFRIRTICPGPSVQTFVRATVGNL